MKIVIAEDNTDDRSLLRCNLENHGCETVIEAGDGAEALALAKLHKPDLIISDALMPHMDGFEFLRAVKIDPALKSIPFIFYSAVYTGYKEEELALSLGAKAFIVKPKEPEELWETLSANLKELVTGNVSPPTGELKKEDEEFIRSYGEIVTTKLEEKVKELEDALARRKEAEDALRDQFSAINTIFDSISAIVFMADLEDDRLLFLNRHGCLLFGDNWKGKKCTEFMPEEHHFCDIPEHRKLAQPPFTWEFKDTQTSKWYQCIERVIPWADGRPVRLAIAFDISERKELDRVKNEMISAVSHEMRTPLTALLGFTEFMLANEVSPAKQQEYLLIIHRETKRLYELIGNFLSLQRLQVRRNREPDYLSVDIGPLLKEVAIIYAVVSQDHRITVDCPPNLPPLPGDGRELREMMDNLVSNAVKFSPDGGEVHLEARQDGDHITILVRDEGIGIPAGMLEKIFERFYQADSGDRRKFRGTGLGLALVRDVVSAHGGRVWAESSVGKGSTFHVLLPLQAKDPRPAAP